METFWGEFVSGIAEIFLDLVGRTKPASMPEITYRSAFTVKYKNAKILAKCLASDALIGIAAVGFVLTHHDIETGPIFILFAALGVITLFLTLYAALYRYDVTEEQVRLRAGFRRKTILWRDVIYVRKIETSNQHSLTLAFYNREGACAFTCDTDMTNAWYLLKMAEAKSVDIREEQDLTHRQIVHISDQ